MLQEKTPLQRKTRSKSAGEGRKAGGRGAAAGRGEGGDSGVASVGLVCAERERAHVYFGRGREEDRALFAIVCRKNLTPWTLGIGSMTLEFWSGAISAYRYST